MGSLGLWFACLLLITSGRNHGAKSQPLPQQGGMVPGGRFLHRLPPTFPEPTGPINHCSSTPNGTHGHISTPNFPRRFPVPISCRWIFHVPPGKKIVLYFTQFYMRESFQLTEYDEYVDERTYRGRHELGTVSFEDEVTSFSVYKPWLVLKFQVRKYYIILSLYYLVIRGCVLE